MQSALATLTAVGALMLAGGAALAVSMLASPGSYPSGPAVSPVPAAGATDASPESAESQGPYQVTMRGGGYTLNARLALADRGSLGTADVNGDGFVEAGDVLAVLRDWGDCPANARDCPSDIDGNGRVDTADIIAVVQKLGAAASERERPLPEDFADAGLTEVDWDDFLDVFDRGTDSQRRNWLCWMRRHLGATSSGECPDADPTSIGRGR